MTGTIPQFQCNDVVLPLGTGESYYDMVEELRRAVWRRQEEEQNTGTSGPLTSSAHRA